MRMKTVKQLLITGVPVVVLACGMGAVLASGGQRGKVVVADSGDADPPGSAADEARPSDSVPEDCQLQIDPYFDTPAFEERHPELVDRVLSDVDGRQLCLTEAEVSALETEQAELEAALRAAGRFPPPGPDPSPEAETGAPDPEGLIHEPDPYTPPEQLVPVNGWEDQRGDVRLIVAAGYRPQSVNALENRPEELGGVSVTWWPFSAGPQRVYYAPEGTPRLRIIEVKDDIALLEAADGRQFSFEIETGKLVEL